MNCVLVAPSLFFSFRVQFNKIINSKNSNCSFCCKLQALSFDHGWFKDTSLLVIAWFSIDQVKTNPEKNKQSDGEVEKAEIQLGACCLSTTKAQCHTYRTVGHKVSDNLHPFTCKSRFSKLALCFSSKSPTHLILSSLPTNRYLPFQIFAIWVNLGLIVECSQLRNKICCILSGIYCQRIWNY